MHHDLLIVLSLLFVMALLYMLSQKLKISYPIFLVLAGLMIGIIPGIPHVELSPEVVFFIFLPPLLYEAAWFTSWYDFWSHKRAIVFMAVGMVVITSAAVAFTSVWLIPGFTLALGFLLGGIVSPPDALAATSVLKGVKVPKRAMTILEGESLLNDASSLIVVRFALIAILTGQFTLSSAVVDFFVVAIMGILIGLAVALAFYFVHNYLPTNASVDVALTLITPYIMYLLAETFHFSGVLAVVSGGLFLSFRSHRFLNYESRLAANATWSTFVFMLNGLVFVLIGLQLPDIVNNLGIYSLSEAIFYGVVISMITIAVRVLMVFPSAYIPYWTKRTVGKAEELPTPKTLFLIGWAGMRGVVSLAAALSIPLTTAAGVEFPYRNLILFITFTVIFITLVLQGLSMPFILRLLKLVDTDEKIPIEEQFEIVRVRCAELALKILDEKYVADQTHNKKIVKLREIYLYQTKAATNINQDPEIADAHAQNVIRYKEIALDIIGEQREELIRLRRESVWDEEVLREQTSSLDLEESRLRR